MEQEKKHSHAGHRQRFKNKVLETGIEHLPYHEVLEFLLMYAIPQKDVNPLAHELISNFGSFSAVLDADYDQLKKIKGVGHETALFISTLPDIFIKYTASKNVDSVVLDTPTKCVNYFRTIDRVRNSEMFYIFCLNSQKRLVKTIKFNTGLASIVNVPITEFAQKISFGANKSIVVVHTHPNGNPEPTQADITATKQLIRSSDAVGVKFNDHVIISNNKFYSFQSSGILKGLLAEVKVSEDQPIE